MLCHQSENHFLWPERKHWQDFCSRVEFTPYAHGVALHRLRTSSLHTDDILQPPSCSHQVCATWQHLSKPRNVSWTVSKLYIKLTITFFQPSTRRINLSNGYLYLPSKKLFLWWAEMLSGETCVCTSPWGRFVNHGQLLCYKWTLGLFSISWQLNHGAVARETEGEEKSMRSDTLHLIPLSAPRPRCLPSSEGEQQIFPPQRQGQSHSRLAQAPLIALTEQGAAKDPVKRTLGQTSSKRLKSGHQNKCNS